MVGGTLVKGRDGMVFLRVTLIGLGGEGEEFNGNDDNVDASRVEEVESVATRSPFESSEKSVTAGAMEERVRFIAAKQGPREERVKRCRTMMDARKWCWFGGSRLKGSQSQEARFFSLPANQSDSDDAIAVQI